jgi:NADPH:quinone reductase-like Zn-dependent oxidoreductase
VAGESPARDPSYELSGTIAALGPGVSDLAVGDAVWALIGFDRDGAAAEFTLAPASVLAPKPPTLSHFDSAAIPLAGLTAWQGLFEHGRLAEGERVLIHGASGGVGQFATQLARWRGACVIGSASGAGVQDALALGAAEAVDRSAALRERGEASYFVVEPSRHQLLELARLVDQRDLRPLVDAVFPLAEARIAFERVALSGKRGKVVLQIVDDGPNVP